MSKMMEIGDKEADETYAALAKDWKPEQIKALKHWAFNVKGSRLL